MADTPKSAPARKMSTARKTETEQAAAGPVEILREEAQTASTADPKQNAARRRRCSIFNLLNSS
jgi:hypothetical protein